MAQVDKARNSARRNGASEFADESRASVWSREQRRESTAHDCPGTGVASCLSVFCGEGSWTNMNSSSKRSARGAVLDRLQTRTRVIRCTGSGIHTVQEPSERTRVAMNFFMVLSFLEWLLETWPESIMASAVPRLRVASAYGKVRHLNYRRRCGLQLGDR